MAAKIFMNFPLINRYLVLQRPRSNLDMNDTYGIQLSARAIVPTQLSQSLRRQGEGRPCEKDVNPVLWTILTQTGLVETSRLNPSHRFSHSKRHKSRRFEGWTS